MTFAALALALALPLQTPKARGAPFDWPTVTAADGSFSCAMPGPARSLKTDASKPGPKAVYFCRSGGSLFSAQVIVSDPPVAKGQESAALDRESKGYLVSNKGTLGAEKKVTLDGYPGRDFTLKGPSPRNDGTVTSRVAMYLVGQDYLIFTVMSPRDQPLPNEAAKFFETISLKGPGAGAATQAPAATGSPEAALRAFLIATTLADEKALRDTLLSTEGIEWLLNGQKPTPAQFDAVRTTFMTLPIRVLKPGDAFEIPVKGGTRTLTVRPNEVDADHAVLLPEGAPVPTRMQKVNGRWRVDASPVIAGRKAAEAARQKKKAAGGV